MSTKKACKNSPSYSFSGKEYSPLGLGYSAAAEDPGTVMEGRDKTMWIVGIRNGVKVWNRVPTQIAASVAKPMEKEAVVIPSSPPPPAPKRVPASRAKKEETVASQPPIASEPLASEVPPVQKRVPASRIKKEEQPQPPLADATPIVPPVQKRIPASRMKKEEQPPAEAAPPQPVQKRVPASRMKKEEPPASGEVQEPQPVVVKKRVPTSRMKKEQDGDAVEKKKKEPNDFNIYMSFRTDQLKKEKPELDHKERFKQASVDWNALDAEMKKNIVAEARAWIEQNKA